MKTSSTQRRRILAVASLGGHWIQLLRITRPLEKQCDVVYMSTHEKCARLVEGREFHAMKDFSRWNAYRIVPEFIRSVSLLRRIRPDAVLTTGAAPGLVVVMAARMLGIRTIWVDSIANVEKLSLCGKLSKSIASVTYTQWPELADEKVKHAGNILGDNNKTEE